MGNRHLGYQIFYILRLIAIVFLENMAIKATEWHLMTLCHMLCISLLGSSLVEYKGFKENRGCWKQSYSIEHHSTLESIQFALILITYMGVLIYCMVEINCFSTLLVSTLITFIIIYLIFYGWCLIIRRIKIRRFIKRYRKFLEEEWEND